MSESRRFELSLVQGKLNVNKLREEIAASLGVDLEAVGVQVNHGGQMERVVAGEKTVEEIPATIEVIAPAGSAFWKAQQVIAAHDASETDADEVDNVRREQMRTELRTYLLEFLQDPELLQMLKAALRE